VLKLYLKRSHHMTITLSLLVLAVIGLLVYALSSNGKVAEIGRLTFACALLALCFEVWPHVATRIR
jgi:hypothetical protein